MVGNVRGSASPCRGIVEPSISFLEYQDDEGDSMPAVTADTLTLPRLPRLSEAETDWRPVTQVVTGQRHLEGEGFQVRRPFPGVDLALADPFILLDHMGAVEYGPGEAKGTPWHPHRGFETVTYIVDGAFQHQDTTGGGGLISDGATQWMTAGAGIQHIEQPPPELVATGGLFHGVQLWVNLPRAQITYLHATVAPGARLSLPWPRDFNALVYVLSGRGLAGAEERPLDEGQLAVFGNGAAI